MDFQARRKLITAFALISGVLVLSAFFAQQYFTYQSETQTLTWAARWADHQLRRVQAAERPPGRLGEAINAVEEKLSRQRLQVPATLDVEGFLTHFTAMAREFDVEVRASHAEFLSLDFYDQAILKLKMAGDDKDIRALFEKLGTGDRLMRYKVLECANKECSVSLFIFSVPEPEEEPRGVFNTEACSEFNSKVWLWPLKGRIQERYEELRTLCEERQKQSSSIRSTEELMGKLRFSQFVEEVIKHLTTTEALQQTE
jgi:hypothetical protein